MEFGNTLLAIFLGLTVTLTFRLIKSEWPLLYVDFTSIIDPIQRRSMSRWVIFRTGPALVCGLFLAVTMKRWDGGVWFPIGTMYAVHLLSIYLVPTIRGLRSGTLGIRQIVLWISSALLVLTAVFLAVLIRGIVEPLVPKPEEMVYVLWTGMFAAFALAFISRILQRDDQLVMGELIDRSVQELESRWFTIADQFAEEHGVDKWLFRAVMIVENIQRPRWFRRIERMIGRFRRNGTYGIMQVRSRVPITDKESFQIAARDHLSFTHSRIPENSWQKVERLKGAIIGYNSNPVFVEMVTEVIKQIAPFGEEVQEADGDDTPIS